MNTPLAVNEKNNLVEFHSDKKRGFPAWLRIAAKIISYIFHPLFIPVYLSWLLVNTQPYFFSALNGMERKMFIPRFAVIYVMFPLVSVLLMKALKFISSIQLKTQKDRIIPYVTCMIYYWWMWYLFHNQNDFPKQCVTLSLAIFLACVGGFMANIFIKVSMHAIAAGVMTAFITLLAFTLDVSGAGLYISAAVLLTGFICTARFIDSDHTPKEIYGGLLIGILSLLVAILFS